MLTLNCIGSKRNRSAPPKGEGPTGNILVRIIASLIAISAALVGDADGAEYLSGGGGFSLRGGVGQGGRAISSGGPFLVAGGFQPATISISIADGPTLSLTVEGDSIVVSWSAGFAGFILQYSDNLMEPNWTNAVVANQDRAVFGLDGSSKYFRLIKP